MNVDLPPQELSWLKRFFSGNNHLSWKNLESHQAPADQLAQVIPWIRFFCDATIDRPIVLPLYGPEGPLAWYGMASEDQIFSQLIDEISSFIGPSYSDFKGEWSELTDDNVTESVLKERFGPRVIRFSGQQPNDHLEIVRSLRLYHGVLSRRPSMPDRTQRPFGRIRGDFDLALLSGNASGAEKLLDELKTSGRVDAEQEKCLEVRLLAGLGRREELARNQSLILSIADLSLPAQTLVDVIDALYETYIRSIEAEHGVGEVIAEFKQNISRPFGPLFKERKGLCQPNVLRAFLLFELTQPELNTTRCDSILAAYAKSAEGRDLAERWYRSLLDKDGGQQPVVKSQTILDMARQAMADEDYETVCKLCFDLLPEYWAYTALLRCASDLGSSEVTQKVLQAVDAASSEIKARFTTKDQTRLDSLRISGDAPSANLDSGWVKWAQDLTRDATKGTAIATLKESVVKWKVEEYVHDDEKCRLLSHLIGNAKGEAEAVYREAFPSLFEFFVERPSQACRSFNPIYSTLLKILGWSGALSADELEIATSLLQALLANGPSREEYTECIEDLKEIICSNNSPVHLDWALNTSELLALYPAQDSGDMRLRVFMEVVSMARLAMHRVTLTQRDVLAILAKDYGCLDLLGSLPEIKKDHVDNAAIASDYKGLIVIYTLTESAGQRAKNILERYFPEARVETNKDPVATDRLISLAKKADVFVFAWKSSKHQAYYCVKEARREGEIIMPLGKGTASIVRSALDSIRLQE